MVFFGFCCLLFSLTLTLTRDREEGVKCLSEFSSSADFKGDSNEMLRVMKGDEGEGKVRRK